MWTLSNPLRHNMFRATPRQLARAKRERMTLRGTASRGWVGPGNSGRAEAWDQREAARVGRAAPTTRGEDTSWSS